MESNNTFSLAEKSKVTKGLERAIKNKEPYALVIGDATYDHTPENIRTEKVDYKPTDWQYAYIFIAGKVINVETFLSIANNDPWPKNELWKTSLEPIKPEELLGYKPVYQTVYDSANETELDSFPEEIKKKIGF